MPSTLEPRKGSTLVPRELPQGWSAHKDDAGRTYYANSETGQVQWLPPPTVRKNAEEIRSLLIQHNFAAADKDRSGVISKAELALMMRRLNPDMTSKELDAMHKAIDKDLDGKVSFEEFHRWILSDGQQDLASKLLDKSSTPSGAISATFRIWDTDGNGKLSRLELATVLRKAMPQISEAHLDSIFQELDGDQILVLCSVGGCWGSGEVDLNEFMNFLYSNPGTRASMSKAQVERSAGWEEVPDCDAARKAHATPTVPSVKERTPPSMKVK
ncbi:Calmodulin-like protein 3 [Durusdinium trenchii]|uniref:Calmodulin-like protein 3 n=1 Tax=Durusdinium trenchii TaxID=1381693 RepID=A0ABP0KZ18_9DINO